MENNTGLERWFTQIQVWIPSTHVKAREWCHPFVIPATGILRKEKSPRFAGQCNHWAPGSVRESLKKHKVGNWLRETPNVNFLSLHKPTHMCTCASFTPQEHTHNTHLHSDSNRSILENQSTQLRTNRLKHNFHWHHHRSAAHHIKMLPQVADADIYCRRTSGSSLSTHQIEALRLSGRQLIKKAYLFLFPPLKLRNTALKYNLSQSKMKYRVTRH